MVIQLTSWRPWHFGFSLTHITKRNNDCFFVAPVPRSRGCLCRSGPYLIDFEEKLWRGKAHDSIFETNAVVWSAS